MAHRRHSENHKQRMADRAEYRAGMYRHLNKPERIEAILAGRHVSSAGIVKYRHKYLPHQGKREIARRAARA